MILQYHHISEDTPASTSTTPADFRRHLEYLRDNDFTVIGLDTMITSLRNHQQLPDKAVAITFDDGYLSIYDTAFPILQSFDFPFALFVSTQPIDGEQNGFMTWDHIREMSDAGVVIANHMVTHEYMLARTAGESEAQWLARQRAELLEAEQRIRTETGQSHRYLAYPYGEFDTAIKGMVQEEDFVGIAQNSGAVGFHSDYLALPRYPLGGSYADLESARTKFDSLAFHVSLLQPESPVTTSNSPSVRLQFEPGNYNQSQLGCYANSQNIPMNWLNRETGLVELNPDQTYNGRRWRYICTARARDANRYYWYSVQWINPGTGE
ncbi:MAG: polysaccharide deacetylase family protein [Pseudohongiellaceae bacterium]